MVPFICSSCGKEIGLYDGVLSWYQGDGKLGNFTITHRPGWGCPGQPRNNVSRDLFRVASMKGYLAFVQYLISRWGEGYVVDDDDSLRKVMLQLNAHLHESIASLLG
ncbi:hypothetical protein [Desulfovirgula thermocuniculi]|uniref:hypothetical protein n=1 Tax=Desulfovirgula thermocuniculi TaxID=348842 RepID=UPI0003FA89CD|nr:hypothetical protein [Desulfovirgula thermocuniculi]